jgi:hypothetical protein
MADVNPRKILRGTKSQNTVQTLPEGVIVYLTDTKDIAVHDGSTPGGTIYRSVQWLQEGYLINGKIVVSVVSNSLTVAVKTLAGNNPSLTDPVYVRIGTMIRTLTASLSVTVADGTNWMGLGGSMFAGKTADLFVYLGYNSSDGVTLGFSRIPYATTYGEFSTTNTAETYCAINTVTNAVSTDKYCVIGRFSASLGASATYYWSDQSTITRGLIQHPIFETEVRAYTPSLTNIAIGSGGSAANTASYRLSGRMCEVEWFATLGSSGQSVSGAISYSTPFMNAGNVTSGLPVGSAGILDNGTAYYKAMARFSTTTTIVISALNSSVTYLSSTATSSSVPMVWAAGDQVHSKITFWI